MLLACLQIHGLDLKFGIYEDYGNKTCAGYPGILQNMELDAQTLASFNIDYLKVDGCNADAKDMDKGNSKLLSNLIEKINIILRLTL